MEQSDAGLAGLQLLGPAGERRLVVAPPFQQQAKVDRGWYEIGAQRERRAIGEDGIVVLASMAPLGAEVEPGGMRLPSPGTLERDPCAVEIDDLTVALVGADLLDGGQQLSKRGGLQPVNGIAGGVRFRLIEQVHGRRASSRLEAAIQGHRGKYSVNFEPGIADFSMP